MASWICHLRIAENLLQRGFPFEIEPFLAGNIGPDCGVPNEDWSQFNPPLAVTHWRDEDGHIQADKFHDRYIASKRLEASKEYISFCYGYYVHLLVDSIRWVAFLSPEKAELVSKKLSEDPSFIWAIKKDWYDLDFVYLREHPDCMFFTHFRNIQTAPDYLDYLPEKAVETQIKHIIDFYLHTERELDRPYPYVSKEEMDNHVARSTDQIEKRLRLKLQEEVRELRGKLQWEGNLNEMRESRFL